jgi:hypothetical protein
LEVPSDLTQPPEKLLKPLPVQDEDRLSWHINKAQGLQKRNEIVIPGSNMRKEGEAFAVEHLHNGVCHV